MTTGEVGTGSVAATADDAGAATADDAGAATADDAGAATADDAGAATADGVGADAERLAERAQLAALRRGDEQAFRDLVGRHQSALLRLALVHAPSRAVAEEVVQETWLAALGGLAGFEGRSSLRTWLARILVNVARRRAGREARSVPFSSLATRDGEEHAVDPARFLADGPYAGHWASFPTDWADLPESAVESGETRAVATAAIARLGPAQRAVITLRDLEGWDAAEVSELLALTPVHQRVLLHRARSRVRQALEDHLDAGRET